MKLDYLFTEYVPWFLLFFKSQVLDIIGFLKPSSVQLWMA